MLRFNRTSHLVVSLRRNCFDPGHARRFLYLRYANSSWKCNHCRTESDSDRTLASMLKPLECFISSSRAASGRSTTPSGLPAWGPRSALGSALSVPVLLPASVLGALLLLT